MWLRPTRRIPGLGYCYGLCLEFDATGRTETTGGPYDMLTAITVSFDKGGRVAQPYERVWTRHDLRALILTLAGPRMAALISAVKRSRRFARGTVGVK